MRVVVGRIGRAHGLHGDVAVEVRTDEPDAVFRPGRVLLLPAPGELDAADRGPADATGPARREPPGGGAAGRGAGLGTGLRVAAVRPHAGRLLVRFAGIDDRTAAEGLNGRLLLVDRPDAARPADPEEYYDHQLIGLAAVDRAGVPLGTVREVVHLPGQDLLALVRSDGGEVLVPFVRALVPRVELAARRVVIDPPPGLLDLAAPGE